MEKMDQQSTSLDNFPSRKVCLGITLLLKISCNTIIMSVNFQALSPFPNKKIVSIENQSGDRVTRIPKKKV